MTCEGYCKQVVLWMTCKGYCKCTETYSQIYAHTHRHSDHTHTHTHTHTHNVHTHTHTQKKNHTHMHDTCTLADTHACVCTFTDTHHSTTHTHTHTLEGFPSKYYVSQFFFLLFSVACMYCLDFFLTLVVVFFLNSTGVSGQIPGLFLPSLQVRTDQL